MVIISFLLFLFLGVRTTATRSFQLSRSPTTLSACDDQSQIILSLNMTGSSSVAGRIRIPDSSGNDKQIEIFLDFDAKCVNLHVYRIKDAAKAAVGLSNNEIGKVQNSFNNFLDIDDDKENKKNNGKSGEDNDDDENDDSNDDDNDDSDEEDNDDNHGNWKGKGKEKEQKGNIFFSDRDHSQKRLRSLSSATMIKLRDVSSDFLNLISSAPSGPDVAISFQTCRNGQQQLGYSPLCGAMYNRRNAVYSLDGVQYSSTAVVGSTCYQSAGAGRCGAGAFSRKSHGRSARFTQECLNHGECCMASQSSNNNGNNGNRICGWKKKDCWSEFVTAAPGFFFSDDCEKLKKKEAKNLRQR